MKSCNSIKLSLKDDHLEVGEKLADDLAHVVGVAHGKEQVERAAADGDVCVLQAVDYALTVPDTAKIRFLRENYTTNEVP